jgi:hypothetical protein
MRESLVTRMFIGGTSIALFVFGASGLPGCSKKANSGTGAAASSATTTAATEPLPHVVIPLPPGAAAFGGRLQEEAAHRPTGTVTAEQVFGTVEVKGIPLHEIQQYMGSSWGAKYCAGAETDRNLFFSVCEYEDPKAAAEGKETFSKIGGGVRPSFLNKNSVLSFRDDARTPESAEQMKVIAGWFAGL